MTLVSIAADSRVWYHAWTSTVQLTECAIIVHIRSVAISTKILRIGFMRLHG
jgi:hypothetical protein